MHQLLRQPVLEAITALEAFVEQTVFQLLESRLDPLLVKWLKDKTKMDFDSRLSVLTPMALDQPVDRTSDLWSRYKRAKSIRNRVTHTGLRVSARQAQEAFDTSYDWLSYLGSTVEVDLALVDFKRYVEESELTIEDGRQAVDAVMSFFSATRAAQGVVEPLFTAALRPDLYLEFGQNRVVVETKLLKKDEHGFEAMVKTAVEQVLQMLHEKDVQVNRAAVVMFNRGPIPDSYRNISVFHGACCSCAPDARIPLGR